MDPILAPELGVAADEAEDLRPYRERAEMFALDPTGKVLGGIYDNDKTHGVFGGGVDPGEDPAQAAAREMLEESGYEVTNPRVLPIDPVVHEWGPGQGRADRRKEFRGSRTHFVTGTLGNKVIEPSDPSNLQDIKLRSLQRALRLIPTKFIREQSPWPTTHKARRQALKLLHKELMNKASATIVEKSLSPEDWQALGGATGQGILNKPLSLQEMLLLAKKLKPGMYVDDGQTIAFPDGTSMPMDQKARQHALASGVAEADVPEHMFKSSEQDTALVDAINTLIHKEHGLNKALADRLKQSGKNVIVTTNAPAESITPYLQGYPFQVFTMGNNPRKSDPGYYQELLRKHNLQPEKITEYLEHNPEAIAAAGQAGIKARLFNPEPPRVSVTETGSQFRSVPFNAQDIVKNWGEFGSQDDVYSVEGPFDPSDPRKDPETYNFHRGTISEGEGQPAFRYEHALDADVGTRQAQLYWDLLDRGHKIDRIIEKHGDPGKWLAYYMLREPQELSRYETPEGEGAWTAGKRLLPAELADEAGKQREWLSRPELPPGDYESWFTPAGRKKYEETLKLVHDKYLPGLKVRTQVDDGSEPAYSDEHQVIYKKPTEKTSSNPGHVLVTGYSGSGKSTTAKQLSDSLQLPLHQLDRQPEYPAFFEGRELEQYLPGGPDYESFQKLRRTLVERALKLKEPHVIEGTHIADSPDLQKGYRTILVNTPINQVVRQRLGRDRKKGKHGPMPPGSSVARQRAQLARQIIDSIRPQIDAMVANPSVEKVRSKLGPVEKTSAVVDAEHSTLGKCATVLSDILARSGRLHSNAGVITRLGTKLPKSPNILFPGFAEMKALSRNTIQGHKVMSVANSEIPAHLKGMGFGRKLYGGTIRQAYLDYLAGKSPRYFTSDFGPLMSEDARSLWRSLKRRGYPVLEGEQLQAVLPRIDMPFGIDLEKMKSFYKDRLKTSADNVYHGSPAELATIEPRPSHVLGGSKAVFGTPDKDLAISFAAPWTDEDFEQGYIDGEPYMREQYPGAFDKIYKGKAGYIHSLLAKGFKSDKRLMRQERINQKPVDVVDVEHIADVLEALKKTRFKLHKHSALRAKGIPDRGYYGNLGDYQEGQLLDFVIQRHLARRAGPHFDVRFGDPKGLHSWVTRKGPLPGPKGKLMLVQQPMHSHKYKDFEGTIPSGYGAGRVKSHRKGQILVTKASPNSIHFTTADQRYPERFVLFRPPTWGKGEHRNWLLMNTTPTGNVPYAKVRYKKIPAEKVEGYIAKMQQGDSVEAKVDGASSLLSLLKDGVELTSYRQSKTTKRPIVHTERFFDGAGKMPIPKDLVGSVLKGELYGQRGGAKGNKGDQEIVNALGGGSQVIPPQELGGILNATLAKAIAKKKEKGIQLKSMLYDIQQLGKKPIDWHKTPRAERRKMMERVMQHLPKDKFHLSEEATTPEAATKMWKQVQEGTHPLTDEGVVMWPHEGPPMKSKLTEDTDVHITGTFPGEGKYKDQGIGGFTYALEAGGPTVGRVGTGLSDEFRREAYAEPTGYTGRVARIRSQQQLPSGAYRAPAFIALHEDYPLAKTGSVLAPELGCDAEELAAMDKEATQSHIIRGFQQTPLDYDTGAPVMKNILSYLQRSLLRGRRNIQTAYNDESLRLSFSSPEARMNRIMQYMKGHDPVMTHPLDRTLRRLKMASSDLDDGFDPSAYTAAGAAALPATSLAQYRKYDLPKYQQILKAAPEHGKDWKIWEHLRPGDVALQGWYDQSENPRVTQWLNRGSITASGGPGTHGAVVGQNISTKSQRRAYLRKLRGQFRELYGDKVKPTTEQLRYGLNQFNRNRLLLFHGGGSGMDTSASGWPARLIRGLYRGTSEAIRSRDPGKFNPVFTDYMQLGEKSRAEIRALQRNPKELLSRVATLGSELDRADQLGRGTIFMRGKGMDRAKELAAQEILKREGYSLYDMPAALGAALKKILLPSLGKGGTGKMAPSQMCTGHHCGSLPATLLQRLGFAKPGIWSRTALPTESLLNPAMNVVGVVNKRKLLADLAMASKLRTGAGLAAIPAMAAVGYGAGKLFSQSGGNPQTAPFRARAGEQLRDIIARLRQRQ